MMLPSYRVVHIELHNIQGMDSEQLLVSLGYCNVFMDNDNHNDYVRTGTNHDRGPCTTSALRFQMVTDGMVAGTFE